MAAALPDTTPHTLRQTAHSESGWHSGCVQLSQASALASNSQSPGTDPAATPGSNSDAVSKRCSGSHAMPSSPPASLVLVTTPADLGSGSRRSARPPPIVPPAPPLASSSTAVSASGRNADAMREKRRRGAAPLLRRLQWQSAHTGRTPDLAPPSSVASHAKPAMKWGGAGSPNHVRQLPGLGAAGPSEAGASAALERRPRRPSKASAPAFAAATSAMAPGGAAIAEVPAGATLDPEVIGSDGASSPQQLLVLSPQQLAESLSCAKAAAA